MREALSLLLVVVYLLLFGIVVFTVSHWNHWTPVAGVAMLMQVCRHWAFSAHLTRSRQWLGLSSERALQAYFFGYMTMGIVGFFDGLMVLTWPFGLIVAFAAFWFAWMWGWIAMRYSRMLKSVPSPPST